LHSIGREAAHNWLALNRQHLGKRSSCDLPPALTP
jgi:hypothetical protein